jgi:hypothetical protein
MHRWSERNTCHVQDGITMPEGLWADGGKLQRDLATITQRIRLMGFNAVRLPFSMKDLFNLSPKYACSATACSCSHGCIASKTTHWLVQLWLCSYRLSPGAAIARCVRAYI